MEDKKKEWILNNIHLKEGGLEDLLFEYADAVIEDYQGRIEDEETLTSVSVSVSEKIDEEVYNLIQAELDRAREEVIKNLIKKIEEANCDSISLELLREINLSKLTTK